MKKFLLSFLPTIIILLSTNVNFGQTPPLGASSDFALFTSAGAFNASGASTVVTGDVGTHVGAFNAFPPGVLVGQVHVADPVSVAAANDLAVAYGFLGCNVQSSDFYDHGGRANTWAGCVLHRCCHHYWRTINPGRTGRPQCFIHFHH